MVLQCTEGSLPTRRQRKWQSTHSKHRLFLFLQFRHAICVLLVADASPSWWDALVVGRGGLFVSIVRFSAYDASDASLASADRLLVF
jgi:hypothetical protein